MRPCLLRHPNLDGDRHLGCTVCAHVGGCGRLRRLVFPKLLVLLSGGGGDSALSVGAEPFGNTVGVADLPVGAGKSNQWRILNGETVTYGWTIGELRLFADVACTQELTRNSDVAAVASAGAGPSFQTLSMSPISSSQQDEQTARAYDGKTFTEWRADCYECSPRQAWLGVRFSLPVAVLCVQLWQWGHGDYVSHTVELQRWEADSASANGGGVWQPVLQGENLDGHRWDTVNFVRCATLQPPDYGRVEITNGGFFPSEATFQCGAARLFVGTKRSRCLADGSWTAQNANCWSLLELMIVASALFALELSGLTLYYYRVMLPRAPPMHMNSPLPEEFQRTWLFEIRESVQPKIPILVVCCPCMRLADTWHGAGLLPYYFGVWVVQLLLPIVPCIGAFFRIVIRHRFGIPGRVANDFCVWLFCCPFAATQEARHVDRMCILTEEERICQHNEKERKQNREQKLEQQVETVREKQQSGAFIPARIGRPSAKFHNNKALSVLETPQHAV
eukprot:TRINITY_DN17208_c0_g1_i1.p1 TRINITY_DN17208_c0_g1~~TRINITY_DN17208_c0_g1_i1.p1  ORF type:complete len:506 (+),score=63.09 TRINITY_DN17208_c0_g1_i1:174-1691(+)